MERKGYPHDVTFLRGKKKTPSELMPRVHRVICLLKRWLMATPPGAVRHKHLAYDLDEFRLRFNRRRSKSRGQLFFRLVHQAVAVEPVPLHRILHAETKRKTKPEPVGLPESSRYPPCRKLHAFVHVFRDRTQALVAMAPTHFRHYSHRESRQGSAGRNCRRACS